MIEVLATVAGASISVAAMGAMDFWAGGKWYKQDFFCVDLEKKTLRAE
jgi:hypothetical protein